MAVRFTLLKKLPSFDEINKKSNLFIEHKFEKHYLVDVFGNQAEISKNENGLIDKLIFYLPNKPKIILSDLIKSFNLEFIDDFEEENLKNNLISKDSYQEHVKKSMKKYV